MDNKWTKCITSLSKGDTDGDKYWSVSPWVSCKFDVYCIERKINKFYYKLLKT